MSDVAVSEVPGDEVSPGTLRAKSWRLNNLWSKSKAKSPIAEQETKRTWALSGVPKWVALPAGLGILFVLFPLLGLMSRVDWSNYWGLITSESSQAALKLSLETAVVSTILVMVIGVPIATVLARVDFPGKALIRALVLLPLVLPPVVSGIALTQAFGRRGLIGQHLEVIGIEIAFTTIAVVISQTFVSLPFLVVSLEGALQTAGQRYETVAATLGAKPTRILGRVTMPLVAPGLVSGGVLAFARCLGEFGATSTFAGSMRGVTRTLPLEIYLQREVDPDSAVALSLLLIVFAFIIVALVYRKNDGSRG